MLQVHPSNQIEEIKMHFKENDVLQGQTTNGVFICVNRLDIGSIDFLKDAEEAN